MDLISPPLIVARYFVLEKVAIELLRARQEIAARELQEFAEEHAGEESLLEDAYDDSGKITRARVGKRLKAIPDHDEPDTGEERQALTRCLELIEAEAEAATAMKEAMAVLDYQVLARYVALTADEIKTLVVNDKWFASIQAEIGGEGQRPIQQLAGRVKELEDRYNKPLPTLEEGVARLSEKVGGHLKNMGLTWA